MFTPLLQRLHKPPPALSEAPSDPSAAPLPQTEQDAEARAARAQAIDADQVAFGISARPCDCGGVDVGDVLHSVHPLEVRACVESDLCPDAGQGAQTNAAAKR